MTPLAFSLCLFCQALVVAGNLLLKHAMAGMEQGHRSKLQSGLWLFGGIALFTLWFFMWLDLLGKYELSQLYAFEGIAPTLVMIAAWLFLGEKVPLRGWIGVSLIGAGLIMVAGCEATRISE